MTGKTLYTLICYISISLFICSCGDDGVDKDNSIFNTTPPERSEFDKWLLSNYTYPYNIAFKYRMEDVEADLEYDLVPADLDKSVAMAKIVKHLWLEAYDEVAGITFTKTYIPKVIHLIGSGAFEPNGSYIAGTAEDGMKITLYNINALDIDNINPIQLNDIYFHVIHHEFAHILQQNKNYDAEFKKVSDGKYVGENWVNEKYPDYLKSGFVTAYARSSVDEDFVELLSIYITFTKERWNERLLVAGTEGAAIILQKLDFVNVYMLTKWGIDIDQLRDVVQRRTLEISDLDLTNPYK